MSWLDRYQQGSFRGVPFFVRADQVSGGRRIVLFEYPLRDEPHAQDLGKKAKGFSLDVYLLGEDYDIARDRLIDALDAAGPGALAIPKYQGQVQVVVDDYTVRHSTDEGGMVRISIQFLPAGRNQFPKATTSTIAKVSEKATALKAASITDYLTRFDLTGRPEWLADNAVAIARKATSYLRTLNGRIDSLTSPISDFAREITALDDELQTLIRTPEAFASRMQSALQAVRNIMTNPNDRANAIKPLLTFGAPPVTGEASGLQVPAVEITTTNRQQEADNQQALIALMRVSAFAELSVALTDSVFESRDAAQAVRDEHVDTAAVMLDAPLDSSEPDVELDLLRDTRLALNDTLHATVRDIEQRSIRLPRVSTFTPQATLPAVVIAYRLYRDAQRAPDIVARNAIRHAGFIAAGNALEVLSRDA